jgi:hypothetical protein
MSQRKDETSRQCAPDVEHISDASALDDAMKEVMRSPVQEKPKLPRKARPGGETDGEAGGEAGGEADGEAGGEAGCEEDGEAGVGVRVETRVRAAPSAGSVRDAAGNVAGDEARVRVAIGVLGEASAEEEIDALGKAGAEMEFEGLDETSAEMGLEAMDKASAEMELEGLGETSSEMELDALDASALEVLGKPTQKRSSMRWARPARRWSSRG